MIQQIDEKLQEILSPTVYLVLRLILQLVAQIGYAVNETIRSTFPKLFAKNVKDEIVLITGAGSGIGRLMAQKLANLGAIIVSIDVNEKANLETVQMIKDEGNKAFGYTCNLADKSAIQDMATKVKREVGNVGILINNAGIVSGGTLVDTQDGMYFVVT